MNSRTSTPRPEARLDERAQDHLDNLSIAVFRTIPRIPPAERDKLLRWGEMVVANHAPPAATVILSREDGACLMLLPDLDPAAADALSDVFGEQLNRLPLFGRAPGNAWTWEVLRHDEQPARTLRMLAQARSALGRVLADGDLTVGG